MLVTENLKYHYKSGKSIAFPDLKISNGDSCLILGQSGVGKTTLLHLLALLLRPKEGHVFIENENTTALSAKSLVSFRAKYIGTVYQQPHFVNALTAKENILLSSYFSESKLDPNYLERLANSLNISELLNKKVTNLSLGEQQRVSIARALINSPKLILADEPTSSLDDKNCESVINLLKEQAKIIGAGLIIVTHDQRLKTVFDNQITLH
jgi:ABC-type lipoprotein export system ATPase subunit